GYGLEYAVVKLDDYRGKRVLGVGGGDSSLDFAYILEPVAVQVPIIHRGDCFRALEASGEIMQQASLVCKTSLAVTEQHGEKRVEAVTVFKNKTREEETIPVDACVFALGFTPDLSKIERWGLELDNDAIVIKNFKMETNLPGVFAAGDIAT